MGHEEQPHVALPLSQSRGGAVQQVAGSGVPLQDQESYDVCRLEAKLRTLWHARGLHTSLYVCRAPLIPQGAAPATGMGRKAQACVGASLTIGAALAQSRGVLAQWRHLHRPQGCVGPKAGRVGPMTAFAQAPGLCWRKTPAGVGRGSCASCRGLPGDKLRVGGGLMFSLLTHPESGKLTQSQESKPRLRPLLKATSGSWAVVGSVARAKQRLARIDTLLFTVWTLSSCACC